MTTDHEQGATEAADVRPFRVLCVCEGNICRSPVAALVLQSALGPDVEVSSAGTRAVVGDPIAPPMVALLDEIGLGDDTFRARQLRADQLRAADLVLTMTRRQRGRSVELAPAVVRRTFTLRELARLLADVDREVLPSGSLADRLRVALPAAAAQRRFVSDPGKEDIADPYGREDAAYGRAFAEIVDAVERIRTVLVPGGASDQDEQGHSGADPASRVGEQNDEGGTIDRAAASASS